MLQTPRPPRISVRSTLADFAPRINEIFTLLRAGGDLELELARRATWAHRDRGARRAFSLAFLGPLAPVQPQQMVDAGASRLTLEGIFIVPLGPAGGRMRYEAVFT